MGRNSEKEHFEAFKDFDRNGNRFISESELREVAESMINAADVDGDGQINYEEFVKPRVAGALRRSGVVTLRKIKRSSRTASTLRTKVCPRTMRKLAGEPA